MSKLVAMIGLSILSAGAMAQVAPRPVTPDETAFHDRVAWLAADERRGREAGTPDYDAAAAWVAQQYARAGVKPAGAGGGYLQPVPLVTSKPGKGSLTLAGSAAQPVALAFGADYIPDRNAGRADVAVDAPLIFAGYGVSAPGEGSDDYAGLDVKGRIVVVMGGAPKAMQGEIRAHYGNPLTKRAEAARRGAVGLLTLYSPTQESTLPFARRLAAWDATQMAWRQPDGAAFDPGLIPGLGMLSAAGAEKLFAGQADVLGALRAADTAGTALPKVTLSGRLDARLQNVLGTAESRNVVGLIPGRDPKLRNEYVVLSAHLDHVGVGTAVNGDTIYNGALDNASGIATMLGVADRFRKAGAPKRSILLVAVTAEEKGLVGSDYFARHPVRRIGSLVANVNLDMPILLHDFTDVVAFGADRSTIGPIARTALQPLGIALTPDPHPEQGIFTRSDHYRFVQQGVPSVALQPGPANGGEATDEDFLMNHYHRPSDDLTLPIRWAQGVRFVDANYAMARTIADAPAKPLWNKGDFFGTLYRGPIAK